MTAASVLKARHILHSQYLQQFQLFLSLLLGGGLELWSIQILTNDMHTHQEFDSCQLVPWLGSESETVSDNNIAGVIIKVWQ